MSSFSPLIADDIGPLILLIFFGCLISAIIYVFFFIPETKGASCLKTANASLTRRPFIRRDRRAVSLQSSCLEIVFVET
jgi:hypothetical protein